MRSKLNNGASQVKVAVAWQGSLQVVLRQTEWRGDLRRAVMIPATCFPVQGEAVVFTQRPPVVDPRNLASCVNLILAISAKVPLFFVNHCSELALFKPVEHRSRK
jgi:hypothetical protein